MNSTASCREPVLEINGSARTENWGKSDKPVAYDAISPIGSPGPFCILAGAELLVAPRGRGSEAHAGIRTVGEEVFPRSNPRTRRFAGERPSPSAAGGTVAVRQYQHISILQYSCHDAKLPVQ